MNKKDIIVLGAGALLAVGSFLIGCAVPGRPWGIAKAWDGRPRTVAPARSVGTIALRRGRPLGRPVSALRKGARAAEGGGPYAVGGNHCPS